MGEVYSALDLKSDPPREVAIKTIRDTSDPASLELFKRECNVLKSFTHPNVIEIYETGELDEGGNSKPFFVMARLRGVTLSQLIKDSPQNLNVQRTVDIMSQVCRGLQAAHEQGLIHRDIKPSNIFVLEDDSVKVIDFGVAHLVTIETVGPKGTLYYMAPEQFEGRPVTAATDVFSLGAVCFEALTGRRAFRGDTYEEIRAVIAHYTPPPVSSLNPAVNAALSQVIHAAMAKRPLNRFSSVREFGEHLKKAFRNEHIERFEPGKLQLRLSRVEKALEAFQYEIAGEILAEVEEEGFQHTSVTEFRRQVDQALRNRDIRQFIESARKFEAQEEYTLALQKVQDALQLESSNAEALELRSQIEAKRSSQQIGNWLNLAQKHLGNCAFEPAREAVSSVLHMLPTDVTALRLMNEINRIEQEVVRKREQKERYFDSAVELRKKGDLTAALSRLQRVLELDREAPDALQPERGAAFQKFYNEVRSESEAIRNALDEAKAQLQAKEYSAADSICDNFLDKYPSHALFQALKFDIGERQRQDLSAYIAEVDRDVEAEPDLDRKVKILEQAVAKYPDEGHFKPALKGILAKRDLINGLVNQARNLEDRGQYSEAIDKWEMLRSIYAQYPGLDFELERLRRRLEQHTRSEAKARWIERIDGTLSSGDYVRALNLVQQALVESPSDAELLPLERLARQRVEQSQRAQTLLEDGQKLLKQKSYDDAIQTLGSAFALDDHNALIRAIYIEAILGKASAAVEKDLAAAEELIDSAFALDATNARVKNMRVLVSDKKRSAAIEQYLSRARELQATDEIERAFTEVEKGLAAYPGEARLMQLQTNLGGSLKQSQRKRDREKIVAIQKRLEGSHDGSLMDSLFQESVGLAKKHPDDEQIQTIASEIGDEVNRRHVSVAPINTAEKGIEDRETNDPPALEERLPVQPEPLPSPSPRRFAKSIPVSSRSLLFVALTVVLVVGSAIVATSLRQPIEKGPVAEEPKNPIPPPLPVEKPVGTAATRAAASLLMDRVDSSAQTESLAAGAFLDILEPLPPTSGLAEWVKVRSQKPSTGYLHLADLEQVQTGDRQFDLGHALALVSNATDPAEIKSRLEKINVQDGEASDIYLELAENYARLAELSLADRNAARSALENAKKYLKLVDQTEPSSERAASVLKSVRSLDNKVKDSRTPIVRPDPKPGWFTSARTAYEKGMALEKTDRDAALAQFNAAFDFSNRILKEDPQNADALKIRTDARDSAVRVAKGK
jgi:serine/threonine protein kinase